MEDQYKKGKAQLKKDIRKFLNEMEEDAYKNRFDLFDEDTIEGYSCILLNRALNLL
jgi:hypothetical protein